MNGVRTFGALPKCLRKSLLVESVDGVAHRLGVATQRAGDLVGILASGAGEKYLATAQGEGIRRAQSRLQGFALGVAEGTHKDWPRVQSTEFWLTGVRGNTLHVVGNEGASRNGNGFIVRGAQSTASLKSQSRDTALSFPLAWERTDDSWIGDWYVRLEQEFAIKAPANGVLRHLCDAEENANLPVHSWFNLKEAFSAEFPVWIIDHLAKTYGFRPTDVLDPFCGGGTTPLALSKLGINAAGVEYNSFIAWVAKVKSLWPAYDVIEIEGVLNDLEFETPPTNLRMTWPKLTTFKDRRYFRGQDVRTLLYVLLQLEGKDMSTSARQFLRAGVAAIVEDVSNLRKDGRALRYIRKPFRPMAAAMLQDHFQRTVDELKVLHDGTDRGHRGECCTWLGSALDLATLRDPWDMGVTDGFRDGTFDLVLYSPPYLNNFDYSETYKLELSCWSNALEVPIAKCTSAYRGTCGSRSDKR